MLGLSKRFKIFLRLTLEYLYSIPFFLNLNTAVAVNGLTAIASTHDEVLDLGMMNIIFKIELNIGEEL
tara:strand:+ start:259 stop:462 length:204 start_codon:yes stop_codon:yes gene_type:complete